MSWKLVPAAVTLRDQINKRWPTRDKTSDGSIGDAAHQQRPSDHNPDADGWVHAIDVDEDLKGDAGDAWKLADQLRVYCKTKQPGSSRIKNIVYENRVCSGTYADKFWEWRYDSSLGHTHHIHISFTDAAERDGSEFNIPILEDDMPTAQEIANALLDTKVTRIWDGKEVTLRHLFNTTHFYATNGGSISNIPVTATVGNAGQPSVGKRILEAASTDGTGTALTDADVDRIAARTADLLAERLKA